MSATAQATTVALWDHQTEAVDHAVGRPAAMLAMDMGEQPAGARVLTPKGWVSFGDLVVGDEVIGVDGRPTRVEECKDWVTRELVRVHLADGGVAPCSLNHLWTVRTSNGNWTTAPLSVIEATLGGPRWFRLDKLPRLAPIEGQRDPLPLDPYVLGVLLAEGSTAGGKLRFRSDDSAIVQEVRRRGFRVSSDGEGRYHNITGEGPAALIGKLGLTGLRSAEKHVPPAYLVAGIDQRLDLLHGLMDGDGSTTGRSAYFTSISEQLARDVSAIARSLGGSGAVWACGRKTVNGHTEWRVTLGLPKTLAAFGVTAKERKRSRDGHRRIVKVERTGIELPMRCIRVSNEDGLYVTDDFIVTHNTGKTLSTIAIVGERQWQRTLILAPKSVVPHWPREFAKFAAYPVRCVALDERKSVAQRVAQAEAAARQPGPLVIVTNHEAAWRPQFSKFVEGWRPECLVVDESHRAKDPWGAFSKWLGKYAPLFRQRIGLTGTPMPHSPLDVFAQYRFLDHRIFGHSFVRFRTRYGIMGGWQGKQVVGYQNTDELAEKFRSIAYECGADVVSLPETVDTTRTVQLGQRAALLYKQIARDFWAGVESGEITASNALTRMLRLQQVTGGHVGLDLEDGEYAKDRRVEHVDTAKQDALRSVLEDLPQGEPVVVFARFVADLDSIHAAAKAAGRSSAELSGRRRELEDWQRGGAEVLATQVQAGGVGVDLTRARVCVYFSLGFSLGEYLQSRKRTHRPGQTRSVLYVHLVAEGTIDEQVYRALEARQSVIEAVLASGR